MSYLLAGGCSFTDQHYKSVHVNHDTTYEKWPRILATRLGIDHVVNTAISGGSNDMMFKAVTDAIVKKTPRVVFVLMTGWDRVSVHNFSINFNTLVGTRFDSNAPKWLSRQKNIISFCDAVLQHTFSVDNLINNTMRDLFLLQQMCDRKNVDLIVGSALWPFAAGSWSFSDDVNNQFSKLHDPNTFKRAAWAKSMINNMYFDKIDHKRVTVGWPFFEELGGKCFWSTMQPEDFIHPDLDQHPNGKAHQKFADIFYNAYRDNYFR